MSIISFLTSHWDDVLAVGSLVGTWLGLRAKSSSDDRAKSLLKDALKAEVYELLSNPTIQGKAREYLADAVARAANRLGINAKLATALTSSLVEEAYSLFVQELFSRELRKLAAGAEGVASTLGKVK